MRQHVLQSLLSAKIFHSYKIDILNTKTAYKYRFVSIKMFSYSDKIKL